MRCNFSEKAKTAYKMILLISVLLFTGGVGVVRGVSANAPSSVHIVALDLVNPVAKQLIEKCIARFSSKAQPAYNMDCFCCKHRSSVCIQEWRATLQGQHVRQDGPLYPIESNAL